MSPEKERFLYFAEVDPQFRFYLFEGRTWKAIMPNAISADKIADAKTGVVAYPSGEILAFFGKPVGLPEGLVFMDGPAYSDEQPGFEKQRVRNGDGGVSICHGPSRSQHGNSRFQYSTRLTNLTGTKIRVTKFGVFGKGFWAIKSQPTEGYYSPRQFREWFRVSSEDGWLLPNETVCDPENYGRGRGVWAYFFENEAGDRFIATVPLENT